MFSSIKNHLSDFVPSFEISRKYEDSKLEKIVKIVNHFPMVPETCFHEAGHSIAFKLLYSDTRTRITIILGEGGGTNVLKVNVFNEEDLGPSILGRQLSPGMRDIVTKGAGPLFSVIYSVGLTALGVRLKNPAIILVASFGLYEQLGYAIRGIFESRTGLGTNDFSELKDRGIHPIFPALGIGYVLMKNVTCMMSVAKDLNK